VKSAAESAAAVASDVAADPKPAQPDDCVVYERFSSGQPVFIKNSGAVVTRMNQPCQNNEGKQGFKKNAGWMAMGVPCTGGDGRIDWKGTHYIRPKMVAFLIETNCAMEPRDKVRFRSEVEKEVGFPKTSSLLALTPFMVQYWEVPDYNEADVGISVELRHARSLDSGWKALREGQPLKVNLIGRENAWVDSDFLYIAEAEILVTAKNRFQIKVRDIRKLADSELQTVKARCEALRPERECQRVF
jgi:hypothetical protein